LKTNTSITELNISGNNLNAEAAVIFSEDMKDMGSLVSLNLANNNLKAEGAMRVAQLLCLNENITEINLASNKFDAECAEILVPAIEAMGSLSSVNLLKNNIGVEQALAIVKIKEAKPNLRTLCGFTLEETEVDMSKQGLLPEDAILLASDIPDMGSLSRLDLSGNNLGRMIESLFDGWEEALKAKVEYFDKDQDGVLCTNELAEFIKALGISDIDGTAKFFMADGPEADPSYVEGGGMKVTGLCSFYKAASIKRSGAVIGNLRSLGLLQSGMSILANASQDMGSLVSLNLAENELGVEGARHVAEVLPKW
jgi:Ran GTPase-activating protein (RanGAP) involved in mRNA processing and transport